MQYKETQAPKELLRHLPKPTIDAVYVAADPGVSGAVVGLHPAQNRLAVLRDFRHLLDLCQGLQQIWLPQWGGPYEWCVLEYVFAQSGWGTVSTWKFAHAVGLLQGLLTQRVKTLDQVYVVPPQMWQRAIRLWYRDRLVARGQLQPFSSVAIVEELMPEVVQAGWLQRSLDHNTADALLLLLWGCRIQCYDKTIPGNFAAVYGRTGRKNRTKAARLFPWSNVPESDIG